MRGWLYLSLLVSISCIGFTQTEKIWYTTVAKDGFITKFGEKMDLPEDIKVNSDFRNGYAIVTVEKLDWETFSYEGSYSFIVNTKGETVFLIKDLQVEKITTPVEGLFAAMQNGKWGFLDLNGKWQIPPIYESVYDFKNGIAFVYLNREHFHIDKNGNKLYRNMKKKKGYQYGKIQDGLCTFGEAVLEPWPLTGYVDVNSNVVIPEVYYYAENFSEGYALVSKYYAGPWFFINTKGDQIEHLPYGKYYSSFENGMAIIQNFDDKVGIINKKGEYVIPCEYDFIRLFVDGYAPVTYDEPGVEKRYNERPGRTSGLYSIIDIENNMIIEPRYYGVPTILEDGVARVTIPDGQGYGFTALIDIEDDGRIIDKGKLRKLRK